MRTPPNTGWGRTHRPLTTDDTGRTCHSVCDELAQFATFGERHAARCRQPRYEPGRAAWRSTAPARAASARAVAVEGGGEDVLDRVGRDERRAPRASRAAGRRGRSRSRAGGSRASGPARCAASDFSRMPPIGSTWPVSVISPVMPTSSATGSPRISDAIAVAIVTPADGPSFGTAPAGTWMWTSCFSNQSSVDAERLRVRAHPRERRLRRLLHHVAELAGQREVALARVRGRLDEEDVAADRGVREPGRDARRRRCACAPRPRSAAGRATRAACGRRRASSASCPSRPAPPPCGRRRRAAARGSARPPRACTRG